MIRLIKGNVERIAKDETDAKRLENIGFKPLPQTRAKKAEKPLKPKESGKDGVKNVQ